jgi:predicted Zn-dependent protease
MIRRMNSTALIPVSMRTRRSIGGGLGRHHIFCVTLLSGLIFAAAPTHRGLMAQEPASSSASAYASEMLRKADAAWDEERYEDATEAYRKAFQVDPSNKHARYRLGWCYNEQKRYADAIWVLKDSVALDSRDEKSRA